MKFVSVLQGSPEWLALRSGKITASCMADAISVMARNSSARKVGDPTAAAERYAADIAIERISGKPHGEPVKSWVLERGHEMEFAARMKYEARTRAYVTESGICIDESDWYAYSSDGLVNTDGLIEIKAPIDSSKIMAMWATGDVSEYIHQMQAGMWLTGRAWCDFLMYVPDLAAVGKDLFSKRIHRNDEFIDAMVGQLRTFQQMAQRYESILRAPAGEAPAPIVESAPPWEMSPDEPVAPAAPDWRSKFLQQQP